MLKNIPPLFKILRKQGFDSSDAWFIGVAKQGLKSLARMSPVIDYYEDKPIRSQVVRMQARWGRGVSNFRYWAGANFSTS